MITNRQKLILKAVIESYNKDGLPVGSSSITDFPYLAKSGATIRADLAKLEENGYIQKTHSSSGRIPTNNGYKFYIENLLSTNKLDGTWLEKINFSFADKANFRCDIINDCLMKLSNIISAWVFLSGPEIINSFIYELSISSPSPKVVVISIITSTGSITSKTLVLENTKIYQELANATTKFNELFKGRLISEVISILNSPELINQVKDIIGNSNIFLKLITNLLEKLIISDNYSVGTNHFINSQINDQTVNNKSITSFDINDYDAIKNLIAEDNSLTVRIGKEIPFINNNNVVLISVPIKVTDTEKGMICVIGHKRLNYEVVVPLLEYTSLQISKLYK